MAKIGAHLASVLVNRRLPRQATYYTPHIRLQSDPPLLILDWHAAHLAEHMEVQSKMVDGPFPV